MEQSAISAGDIALVGMGNVASHIARAIMPYIGMVVRRGEYDKLKAARPRVIIFSIADHALADVVAAIGELDYQPLVLHTSGTLPKETLSPLSPRTGVLYPLQTFSKDVAVDMGRVPFFIEAAREEDYATVDAIARLMSGTVHRADAARRRVLHIAGVFSSNFVNVLLEMVEDVLGTADYPLSTVQPLVEATVAKAFEAGPHAAQTGPARRGDAAVMLSHQNALPDDKRLVYKVLSDYIVKSQNVTLK